MEAIRNFDEEKTVMNIQNNYDSASNNNGPNYYCSINPIDKWIEALEENKKLYKRLLQAEKEKNEMLKRMLDERK